MSKEALQLVLACCNHDDRKRLSMNQLSNHPYFKSKSFTLLTERELKATYSTKEIDYICYAS